MALITEDLVEQQSIEWFRDLGYDYVCGYDIAPDGETPERCLTSALVGQI
jgi:type I restriction enzyme R subunit